MENHQHQFSPLTPRPASWQRRALAAIAAFAAGATVALTHGFDSSTLPAIPLAIAALPLVWLALVLWGDVSWSAPPSRRWRGPFGSIGEIAIAAALLAELLGVPLAAELIAIAATVAFAIRINSDLARSLPNPTILFPGSFLVLIAVSAALLKLPAATPPDRPIGWVDAFFTATSAVCVTGLTVRDTGAEFTLFGQAVVLGSIQVGGLGVMIFGSTLALLFGARLSFKEHVTLSRALDEYPAHRIARFVWFIVLTAVAMEAVGVAVLYLTWPADQLAGGSRAWHAVFHSVSAFCNAGFDITGQSMIGVRSHPAAFLGIAPMILLGGIGFIVLEDVLRCARARLGATPARLTTHSKLVLSTTAALLIAGFIVILIAQTRSQPLSFQSVLDAAFMSVTARTAGFTTVPMDELSPGSRFGLMVLMAIGGSPGSTAGGMKTVVFATLLLAVVSTVRARDEVEVFGRSLSDALVKKAATVAAGLFCVVALGTLVLDLTERVAFEPLLFEVISAASTTGLSLGATAELSPTGRIVVTVTMFLGRVGALSLLAALIGAAGAPARYRLPRDTVSLG